MTWKYLVYEIEDKLESLLDYREKPKEIKIKGEIYLCKTGSQRSKVRIIEGL